MNSSVIFPLGPAAVSDLGGGEEAAAEVAYLTARERRNPVGEGRWIGFELLGKGEMLEELDRRREADRRREDRTRRVAMAAMGCAKD